MAEENNSEIRKANSSAFAEEDVSLDLTLACNHRQEKGKEVVVVPLTSIPIPKPTPETNVDDDINEMLRVSNYNRGTGRQRRRTSPRQTTIQAPYPWATERRAIIHDLETLCSRNIKKISGKVRCNRCLIEYQTEHDLTEKLSQLLSYFMENIDTMKHRAPEVWMSPVLPTCKFCDEKGSVKPVISEKKKSINWLFLLLDQTLGCCTLEQLKYFCKYTKNHRTGAKDRLLFSTYITLCRQLVPDLCDN